MNHADILSIMELDCFRILCMLGKKDLDCAEVARILNLESSVVRHWRRGTRQPRDPYARRLAALFELYYPKEPIPQISDKRHATEIQVAV